MGTSSVRAALAAIALVSAAAAQDPGSQRRPNIVIILADDMGFNDLGFRGSEVRTPNLDALAAHGIILNRFYVQPSCTPSRSALLTAKYPSNVGMQGLPLAAGVPQGLPLHHRLMPQYLKDLGYKSHLVGKWHVGYETWAHVPTRRGFDSFFGYFNGFTDYYAGVHTQTSSRRPTFIMPPLPAGVGPQFQRTCNRQYSEGVTGRDMRRNEEPAWKEVYGEYLTDILTKEAVKVVKSAGEDPFLLMLHHMAPHTGNLGFRHDIPPNVPTNMTERQYYAEMVRWLDDSVGEIVQSLDEENLLNDTILVFMSDNGAPTHDPIWNYSNYGSNYPLRGEKMSVHDGGVRTTAVVWSASLSRNPRISNQLFHITDWLPTLYSAAGGNPGDLISLDGIDQWESLVSAAEGPRKEVLVDLESSRNIEAYIKGQWKIVKDYPKSADHQYSDGYYGVSGRDAPYDAELVESSPVGRILGKPKVPYQEVRRQATLAEVCEDKQSSLSADCVNKYCLYNILEDPTECRDRAKDFPDIYEDLAQRIDFYRTFEVVRGPRVFDPEADPCFWDDYWTPWRDNTTIGTAGPSSGAACTLHCRVCRHCSFPSAAAAVFTTGIAFAAHAARP